MDTSKPVVGRVGTCPLCGGPNACAPACCGSLDVPCWCTQVSFAPALLARVRAGERGVACICAACALRPVSPSWLDSAP